MLIVQDIQNDVISWLSALLLAKHIPLPLIVSCFSKIQIGFTFLVPAHPGRPGQSPESRKTVVVVVVVVTG